MHEKSHWICWTGNCPNWIVWWCRNTLNGLMFCFVYKTPAKLHSIFDIQFSFFFAELQMAKFNFARWHLTKKTNNKRSGSSRRTHPHRGTLGEPRGTLGEPILIPGELSGNHPRETSGNRGGSQISSLNENLKSQFKNEWKPMVFATLCNLPARCHLHSYLLHICLSQTF